MGGWFSARLVQLSDPAHRYGLVEYDELQVRPLLGPVPVPVPVLGLLVEGAIAKRTGLGQGPMGGVGRGWGQ